MMTCRQLFLYLFSLVPLFEVADIHAQSAMSCLNIEQQEKLRQDYLQIIKMFEVDPERVTVAGVTRCDPGDPNIRAGQSERV